MKLRRTSIERLTLTGFRVVVEGGQATVQVGVDPHVTELSDKLLDNLYEEIASDMKATGGWIDDQ